MKRFLITTSLLVLPFSTFAVDYQHGDDQYSDSTQFSTAERAAISALTDLGAVSGNPDGSFAPDRTLNRAEFAKIATLALRGEIPDTLDRNCFPDVRASDWFSPYVCRMVLEGAVEGNPDGLYHPERAVNYAEAVKIMVELAEYDLPEPPENERWTWYRAYLLAAEEAGVALPSSIEPAHELTRGQMARFAAAVVAQVSGTLDEYRNAERGIFGTVSSASSSRSSSSVSSSHTSSSLSSSSLSSSSSRASTSLFPAHNSFLLAGTRTPLVLGGTVTNHGEAGDIRFVHLALRREINSIKAVYLVKENGDVISELRPATLNNTDDRKWEATLDAGTYTLAADTPTKIGIRFDLWPRDVGGSSNELVEVESFSMQTEGKTTGESAFLLFDDQAYPVHQTSFGRLTEARMNLTNGTLQEGADRRIASVQLRAQVATGSVVRISSAEFLLSTTNVNVSTVRVTAAGSGVFSDCGVEKLSVTRIFCTVAEGQGLIPPGGLVLEIYANVDLADNQAGELSVSLEDRGSIGDRGSFVWTDDSGQFNWIEEGVPFGGSVTWTVTPQ